MLEDWDLRYCDLYTKKNRSQSYFLCLFFFFFQAVGILDSRYHTVGIWDETATTKNDPYQRGVVYYLNDENKVMGILLWGVPDKVPLARHIVNRGEKYPTPEHLTNLISLEKIAPATPAENINLNMNDSNTKK